MRSAEHEIARGIDAVDHQVRDAVRERIGLAGAGTGNDQQRPGAIALLGQRFAMSDGLALRSIEPFEMRGRRGHGRADANYTLSYTSAGHTGYDARHET